MASFSFLTAQLTRTQTRRVPTNINSVFARCRAKPRRTHTSNKRWRLTRMLRAKMTQTLQSCVHLCTNLQASLKWRNLIPSDCGKCLKTPMMVSARLQRLSNQIFQCRTHAQSGVRLCGKWCVCVAFAICFVLMDCF